ncbi:/ gpsA / Glycerol-3-phosphate dehydrogenase [NAD(P)+] /:99081 Forward [Candidatus Hepatoplasma crinochetorum]|uniref:Glycerol-3-phosphate dehydrogenase [NAD(P)+] n=1 Tax=Candidatus Hepatoplasma crinochetorum TaxID=295596 RepID=A0A0G7ZNC9_9MOLU|nr:/ gpsA / Glycerol-3-phosphate dehydrogenase [NAD(P)+] /:99081 Forward [Candidatus Hepatoplasma crinochetorum]
MKNINFRNDFLSDYNFTIIGSGAFGTAVANFLVSKNDNVIIYGIDEKEISDIQNNHKNTKYFESIKLKAKLKATTDIKRALQDADIILIAIPSHSFRDVLRKNILPNMKKPAYFVNLAKGLDYLEIKFLNQIIEEEIPQKMNLGVLKLSGPSFAKELVEEEPTKFVLACKDIEIANNLKKYFETEYTKIVTSNAIVGIEALSVIKNSLAILLGIVNGLGYGMNSRAYIFTESLEEMKKIVKLYGFDENIIFLPAGVGDLYLTGNSKKSRNFSVGYKIGKANKVNKKILNSFVTIEGLRSIEIIFSLAIKKGIKLNLFNLLYNITYKNIRPSEVMDQFFKGIDK